MKLRRLDPSGGLELHYVKKLSGDKLLAVGKNLALLSVYGTHYSALAEMYFHLAQDKGCQQAQTWLNSCYPQKSE